MSVSLVVRPTGDVEEVELPEDVVLNLAVMYRALQCRTMDVVHLDGDIEMWVDADGVDHVRSVNVLASRLAEGYGVNYRPFVGSVLLCSSDGDGGCRNLSDEHLSALRAQLEILGHW